MVFPLGPHRIPRFSDSAQVTWPALCKLISLGNAGLEIPIYGAIVTQKLAPGGKHLERNSSAMRIHFEISNL